MNQFEEYLKGHKEELKVPELEVDIWISIEKELLQKKSSKLKFYLRAAATVFIIIASATIIKYTILNSKSDKEFSLSIYSSNYGIMEKNFKQAIYYQTSLLQSLKISPLNESDFNVLTSELKELDNEHKSYTDRIEHNGYDDDIGGKILQCYSLKLELLKKIQFEINKINNFKKSNTYENNKINLQI